MEVEVDREFEFEVDSKRLTFDAGALKSPFRSEVIRNMNTADEVLSRCCSDELVL